MIKQTIVLVMFLFLITGVSAISTTFKERYSPGETAIFQVDGNILEPISSGQISFLRGHVSVPFEYGSVKIGGVNYIWVVMPQTEQNYTLKISSIQTVDKGVTTTVDYLQNFSVKGNLSGFSITPGAIKTNKDFEINVFSYEDNPITTNVDFPESREILVVPGDNKIKFTINKVTESSIFNINFGNYILPTEIIVAGEKDSGEIIQNNANKLKIEFTPNEIKRVLFRENLERGVIIPLSIKNIGNESIKQIGVEYNKDIFMINKENISELKANQEARFNLTIKSNANFGSQDKVLERVKFISENLSSVIFVELNLPDSNNSTNNTIQNNSVARFSCAEYGGKVCSANQNCEGELKSTAQGSCCIGYCVNQEPKPVSYAWMGYVGIALALLIGAFAWYKYKGFKFPIKPIGATPKAGIIDKPSA